MWAIWLLYWLCSSPYNFSFACVLLNLLFGIIPRKTFQMCLSITSLIANYAYLEGKSWYVSKDFQYLLFLWRYFVFSIGLQISQLQFLLCYSGNLFLNEVRHAELATHGSYLDNQHAIIIFFQLKNDNC